MLRVYVNCLSCYITQLKEKMLEKILYLVCNKMISHFFLSDILLNYTLHVVYYLLKLLYSLATACVQPDKCNCVNKENGCTRLKTVVLRSGEVIVCKDKDKHITHRREIIVWGRTYTVLSGGSHSFYLRKINRVYFLYISADENEIKG